MTSGSSFGANPLRQMIGLGKAERVALLQIDWPTSATTQVFRDIAADQTIEITELETRLQDAAGASDHVAGVTVAAVLEWSFPGLEGTPDEAGYGAKGTIAGRRRDRDSGWCSFWPAAVCVAAVWPARPRRPPRGGGRTWSTASERRLTPADSRRSCPALPAWKKSASLEEIREVFRAAGQARHCADRHDARRRRRSASSSRSCCGWSRRRSTSTTLIPSDARRCSRKRASGFRARDAIAQQWLYSVIYFQGVSAMRLGENENCILCRGESSCIVPFHPAAVHTKPDGIAGGDRVFHRIPRAVSR